MLRLPHDKQLTVFCNSGKQKNTFCGNCPGFGGVWHNANSLANIVSFSFLDDLFTIEYDQYNQQLKCYISNSKTICFKCKGGLYVYDTTHDLSDSVYSFALIQTESENMKKITPAEIAKAEHTCCLYITLGCPSYQSFRWMLLHNKIKNATLQPKNADNANEIFGPDISSIKGKMV